MDFITDLPRVKGKSVIIMVVVYRLSIKVCTFQCFIPPKFIVSKVAEIFVSDIIKLHGIPTSIVSDKDRVFTSKFWRKLHELSGIKLKFSPAYHRESDGQTKMVK